jgi:hypothetical protein
MTVWLERFRRQTATTLVRLTAFPDRPPAPSQIFLASAGKLREVGYLNARWGSRIAEVLVVQDSSSKSGPQRLSLELYRPFDAERI